MPRTIRDVPARASPARSYQLTGGNGTSAPHSLPDRMLRLEAMLETVQQQLAVQFQRTAEVQAQLDRLIASRSKSTP